MKSEEMSKFGPSNGLTVIIHTKNEERFIAQAISSVLDLASEILVVDMKSSDATVEIAKSMGAKIIYVDDFGFVEPARKIALSYASNDWILFLDADEIVSSSLASKIKQIIVQKDYDAVLIPFVTHMFGNRLYGSGWSLSRERHWRLFRLDKVLVSDMIHTPIKPVVGARELELPISEDFAIIHFNYIDWSHFFSKMNRYTSVHANEFFENGISPSVFRTIKRITRQIITRTFIDNSWRDGRLGFQLVSSMVIYELFIDFKLRQLNSVGSEKQIISIYEQIASDQNKNNN